MSLREAPLDVIEGAVAGGSGAHAAKPKGHHMPKITDTQSVLLTHAARQKGGSIYPLPEALTHPAGVARSISALLSRGWAEERSTAEADTAEAHTVAYTEADVHYGFFITAAGYAAIGIEEPAAEGQEEPAPAAPRTTKAALVLSLLCRDEGATLADLISATNWQPHTMRAALTGLRKKGHSLHKSKRDGATCYRIAAA